MSGNSTIGASSERRKLNLTKAQRAAIIVSVLGQNVARPVADKLDDLSLQRVASALGSIDFISREDVIAVVVDFLQQLRNSDGALQGGPARAREVMSGIVDKSRMKAVFNPGALPDDEGDQEGDEEAGSAEGTTWQRLAAREPEQVAAYLNRLSANLIAIILGKIDPTVASSILCFITEDKMRAILARMVDPPKTDGEIEAVICRMIEIEFLNVAQDKADEEEGHLESLGEMLSLIPTDRQQNIVSILRENHESKMPIIQRGLFTIAGLPEILSRIAVPVVFKETDQDLLMRFLSSLRSGNEDVLEYLLSNISQRLAEQYRDDLKDTPVITGSDAEAVHREFLTQVMDLRRRGRIKITKSPPR